MTLIKLINDSTALLSMRESDFDAYSAYCEVIDNSIQANALNVKIKIDSVSDKKSKHKKEHQYIKEIAFGDDGDGMDSEILHRCLQLGYSSRYNDRTGIGRFGVGMTLAAINQCKRIEIYSKCIGQDWLYTYIDLDEITQEPIKMEGIPIPIKKDLPINYREIVGVDSGTLVLWRKYDRQHASAEEIEREFQYHIGRTFRKFIWGDREFSKNGEINFELNHKKIFAVDPLYVNMKYTNYPDDIPATEEVPVIFNWPIDTVDKDILQKESSQIKIRLSLIDEKYREYAGSGGSQFAKLRYIDRNEGISILRNGREVFYGQIPYWGRKFEDIGRFWGCEIQFNAELDRSFMVRNIKRGAIPTNHLKSAIYDRINPTLRRFEEKISDKFKQTKIGPGPDPKGGVKTGHEAAEEVAKKADTDPKLPRTDEEREQSAQLAVQLKGTETNERQALWATKFESQPYTIIDDNWKGSDFIDIKPSGGSDVILYNTNHLFIEELYSIIDELDKIKPANIELAHKLKSLIDLLIISYAKAESKIEKKKSYTAEVLFEDFKMHWGHYLKNYITTWKSDEK